jgi:hypothetical protein
MNICVYSSYSLSSDELLSSLVLKVTILFVFGFSLSMIFLIVRFFIIIIFLFGIGTFVREVSNFSTVEAFERYLPFVFSRPFLEFCYKVGLFFI